MKALSNAWTRFVAPVLGLLLLAGSWVRSFGDGGADTGVTIGPISPPDGSDLPDNELLKAVVAKPKAQIEPPRPPFVPPFIDAHPQRAANRDHSWTQDRTPLVMWA